MTPCRALCLIILAGCRGGAGSGKASATGGESLEERAYAFVLFQARLERQREDGAHASVEVSSPALVAGDSSGTIFLFDEAERRVIVLATTGQETGYWGAPGGGPGEYRQVAQLQLGASGTLEAVDLGKRAIVRFSATGAPLPERSFATLGFPSGGIRMHGDTVVMQDRYPTGMLRVRRLRWLSGSDTVTLDSVVVSGAPPTRFRCPDATYTLNVSQPLLSSDLQWDAQDGMVAVAVDSAYAVKVFHGTRLVATLRRDIAPPGTTPADLEAAYPDGFTFGPERCRHAVAEVAAVLGAAATVPLIRGIRFNPFGGLWVTRVAGAERRLVSDVYDARLAYLGSVEGVGLPLAFLGATLVLGVEPDPERGTWAVKLYRLRLLR